MSSVRPVPETRLMTGEELSADDAAHTLRRYGLGHLLSAGFLRFRYGDGFSHARAFGLQLALAAVPLIIAGVGLSAAAGAEGASEVVARTVLALSPGTSDELVAEAVRGAGAGEADPDDPGEQAERDDTPTGERGELVLALGLLTAAGYDGWYVLEQDTILTEQPEDGAGPVSDVAASIHYLRSLQAT